MATKIKKSYKGNYFRSATKGFLDFTKYEKIVREEVRAVHVKWGERMVAGYNKIVASWSPEVRPHFQTITRYYKSTKNVFVYVYIRGTPKAKLIFDMIDHGATRGQTVTAGPGIARTKEEEAVLKNYREPPSPITYPSKPSGSKPVTAGTAAWRAWSKYEKDTKLTDERVKKSRARAKTAEQKRGAGPGRTKKGSRLGPTHYTPRTNKGGSYHGAGYSASANPAKSRNRGATSDSNWRGRGQPKKMKLKPIKARRYTLRLTWLIKGRAWPHAEEIWGSKEKMLHKNIVALGYRNVARAVKASK